MSEVISVKANMMIQANMTVDSMEPRDWEQVRSIYIDGIATGQATFEIDAPSWEAWDDSHLRSGRLVARAGDELCGWAALSAVSRRPAYAGVAEVSIYVASEHRNQGIGRALLERLIAESEEHGI